MEYEVLSPDAAFVLQKNFILALERQADKFVPQDLPEDLRADFIDATREYLFIGSAQRKFVKNSALAALVGQGKDAVRKSSQALKDSRGICFLQQTIIDRTLRKVGKARVDMNDHAHVFHGQGLPRLYIKAKPTKTYETQKKVEGFLTDSGYTLKDYKEGYAVDNTGKQVFRIGKILRQSGNGLYDAFVKDSARNTDKQLVVISRSPLDIAMMSTNRRWDNCMAADDISFEGHIPKDIEEGTLVAYLISARDPNIFDPLARVLIKPYERFDMEGSKERLFVVDKIVWGQQHDLLRDVVVRFVEDHINKNKVGDYKLVEGLFLHHQESGVRHRCTSNTGHLKTLDL